MSQGSAQRLLPVFVAILLGGVVYLNTLHNPFVYDDHTTIVGNPSLADISNLPRILLHIRFRPLANLSYAIDRAIWGLEPFGFHLSNLLLHLLNVGLTFVFIDRALIDRRQRVAPDTAPMNWSFGVFLGAALFAVHPLMSEAVGYTSARPELLATCFVLIAMLCARRWLIGNGTGWLGMALVSFVLGLASKETAAVFPFLLLAYDRWFGPGLVESRRRRLARVELPLIGLVALAAGFRLHSYLGAETASLPRTIWQNSLTQSVIVWRYLGLWFWPRDQSLVHPAQSIDTPWDPRVVLSLAGLGGLMLLAWLGRRRIPLTSLGILWFLIALAPSSSLVPLNELMAEHRTYLPAIGLSLIVTEQWLRYQGLLASRPTARRMAAIVAIVTVGVLSSLTVARNRVWAEPILLWQEAVRRAPNTFASHFFLAEEFRRQDRCEEAVPAYWHAAKLLPEDPSTLLQLGVCLAKLGRFDEAFEAFRTALEIEPQSVPAHTNMGYLMAAQNRYREAEWYFQSALRIRRDPATLYYLAMLRETTYKDPGEALALCQEAAGLSIDVPPRVLECIDRNQRLLNSESRSD